MAQESKAVDLGKLQDMQRKAEVLVQSANRVREGTGTKLSNAIAAHENSKKKYRQALDELDKAKQAVLDGARSVAQG